MHDSIMIYLGNYSTTAGPTIPIMGGIPIAPLVGSFLAIVVSVAIAMITIKRNGDSNRRYIDAVEESSRKHIEAVEKTSVDQIIEARYWRDLKRIQQLKSLVQELEENVKMCNNMVERAERKEYIDIFSNLFLTASEKCLADTPIDDDAINHKLLVVYYTMKACDNAINVLRIRDLSQESVELVIEKIAWDYTQNKEDIENTIKLIKLYVQDIRLYPPAGLPIR